MLSMCFASQIRDWTSSGPARVIQPGERTGKFRLSKDDLVTDQKGGSRTCVEGLRYRHGHERENPKHGR